METSFRLGIQSYCFRVCESVSELIGALGQVGLRYVELWPGHQPLDVDPAILRGALAQFAAHGITVDACGCVSAPNGKAIRPALEFARLAGIKAVTADPDPEPAVCKQLEQLCDEYDVNIAVHNHGRDHRLGTIAALDELFSRTSPRIGLCLDTGWLLDAGDDVFEAVARFGDRLYGVHLKDFAYDDDGTRHDVIAGEGMLDLPRLMSALRIVGYQGYLSIEYEGDMESPLPSVRKCVQAVQATIDAL